MIKDMEEREGFGEKRKRDNSDWNRGSRGRRRESAVPRWQEGSPLACCQPEGGGGWIGGGRESRGSLVRSSTSDPVARHNELTLEQVRRRAGDKLFNLQCEERG